VQSDRVRDVDDLYVHIKVIHCSDDDDNINDIKLSSSTTTLSITHHPVSEITFLRNFTSLLMMKTYHSHLISLTSVCHFLHHHCHRPSLLLSSTPRSKLIFSTNPFLHSSFTIPPTDFSSFLFLMFRKCFRTNLQRECIVRWIHWSLECVICYECISPLWVSIQRDAQLIGRLRSIKPYPTCHAWTARFLKSFVLHSLADEGLSWGGFVSFSCTKNLITLLSSQSRCICVLK